MNCFCVCCNVAYYAQLLLLQCIVNAYLFGVKKNWFELKKKFDVKDASASNLTE